jgi:hypothetical protein
MQRKQSSTFFYLGCCSRSEKVQLNLNFKHDITESVKQLTKKEEDMGYYTHTVKLAER